MKTYFTDMCRHRSLDIYGHVDVTFFMRARVTWLIGGDVEENALLIFVNGGPRVQMLEHPVQSRLLNRYFLVHRFFGLVHGGIRGLPGGPRKSRKPRRVAPGSLPGAPGGPVVRAKTKHIPYKTKTKHIHIKRSSVVHPARDPSANQQLVAAELRDALGKLAGQTLGSIK
jgi:hypothetical protein